MTFSAIRTIKTTAGRLARRPSCCATLASLDLAEIAMPTHIDQVASSGVKITWASRSGPWINADATPGCANSTTSPTKIANTAYAIPSDGMRAASALPRRNSSGRMGVVSAGSRVPCWRSPTTAYAATKTGTSAGMPSMYSRTCSCRSEPDADAARAKTATSGWML